MRVVRFAHDVVDTDLVDAGDPVMVLDEAAEHVLTEQLPEIERVEIHVRRGMVHEFLAPHDPIPLLVEDLLGPLEEVGHPSDLALGQRDLEVGIALEHATEQP